MLVSSLLDIRGLCCFASLALLTGACDSKDESDPGTLVGAEAGDDDDDDDDDGPGRDDPEDPQDPEDPEGPEAPEGSEDLEGQPCDTQAASNTCLAEDAGVQYCDVIDGNQVWGPCLDPGDFFCEPGDSDNHDVCVDEGDCWTCTDNCVLDGGEPVWESWANSEHDCNTPLVLSFDSGPVQMEPAPAATFDIDAAGGCTTTDWPAAVTPWLALDRDGDGVIASGRELFGSGTRLESGRRAPNGFTALTELDDNGDGRIDPTDAAFVDLVLWADEDADKRSSWFELQPLAARGILSIELGYEIDRQCDDRGNCAVERASFTFIDRGGEIRDGEVVDMHLSCQ